MRHWKTIAVLAAVQVGLVAGYLGVEAVRASEAPFAWEPLDEPAPALSVSHASEARLSPEAPHLVHFWATWCAPCLEELPGLLEAAEETRTPLLAVTDEPWPVVSAWFDGAVPHAVVRDPSGEAAARWQVSGLPDTFVVAGGRITARVGGPRDWSSREARRFLREVGQ